MRMGFSEVNYTHEQAAFFSYLKEIGVVLNTVILNIDELPSDVYSVTRDAAKEGMQILSERFKKEMQISNPGVEGLFNIEIDPNEELSGEQIAFDDFIGEGYDFKNSKIKLFSYDSERMVITGDIDDKGFARALLVPPHSLKFKRHGDFLDSIYVEAENRFYTEIIKRYLKEILHIEQLSDANFLEIISWSDNWTNYFDDGKEWWGTFCWTIYDVRYNTITFIAASSTD